MRGVSTRSTARRREMLEVSRAYYFEDKSKVQIADELGMSRFRVAKLLTEARETGLVTVTLNVGGPMPELSERVQEHLKLREAVVVEAYGDLSEVRAAVGRAAGTFLAETLRDGEVLGIAWSRTLNAMIDSLDHLPGVDAVQLTGVIGSNPADSPIELVRKTALLSGRSTRAIMAPYFVEDARSAAALRRDPRIAEVFRLFDTLTTAVIAVGSLRPEISQALAVLPPRFCEALLAQGGQAEICGIYFDEDGDVVDSGFLRHRLGIGVDQLRRTPRVIAVTSDTRKACAVLAMCRSRLINELVIDVELAQALLAMPAVPAARTPAH